MFLKWLAMGLDMSYKEHDRAPFHQVLRSVLNARTNKAIQRNGSGGNKWWRILAPWQPDHDHDNDDGRMLSKKVQKKIHQNQPL